MRQLCKGNVAVMKGAIAGRMPLLLRISHHSRQRDRRVCGTVHSAGRRHVSAGGKRSRGHQHGVRRGCRGGPRHDRIFWSRPQLDAGRHLLPCRRRTAVRHRGRGARRPGLGNIAPEQSDYFAIVKGGGHGNYRNIVLAPASVQEMADLTILAFELADKYRNPAVVMADGFIGQMMEPLELEYREIVPPEKPWAVKGTPETRKNLISSIYLEPDDWKHTSASSRRSIFAPKSKPRYEGYQDRRRRDPAGRLRHRLTGAALGRAVGYASRACKAGLFRPITLWPFPSQALVKPPQRTQKVFVVELSNGQMVEDVRLDAERESARGVLWPGRRKRSFGGRIASSRLWSAWASV